MEGRCSFAALSSIKRSLESVPDRTTVRSSVPQLSLETYSAKVQRTRWKNTYCILPVLCVAKFFSCEIQLYSMNKPHKLIVLRSLTWVAFILVHSALLHGVNRVILRTHQRLRTLWDLYHVEFTQHEQLGLKENFHYPSAVYNLRHLSEKQWYHPEGIVCTCFKVGL